eukprot:m.214066 g.214066  ORF g.214066 m.214066 type:complete len:207 (+) comp54050_c0_seq10:2534-3154(+)
MPHAQSITHTHSLSLCRIVPSSGRAFLPASYCCFHFAASYSPWAFVQDGSSCGVVCADKGGNCQENSLDEITTLEQVGVIAIPLGLNSCKRKAILLSLPDNRDLTCGDSTIGKALCCCDVSCVSCALTCLFRPLSCAFHASLNPFLFGSPQSQAGDTPTEYEYTSVLHPTESETTPEEIVSSTDEEIITDETTTEETTTTTEEFIS